MHIFGFLDHADSFLYKDVSLCFEPGHVIIFSQNLDTFLFDDVSHFRPCIGIYPYF